MNALLLSSLLVIACQQVFCAKAPKGVKAAARDLAGMTTADTALCMILDGKLRATPTARHLESFNSAAGSTLAKQNGFSRRDYKDGTDTTRLRANGQWKKFSFGSEATYAVPIFTFRINAPHVIDVTDYYCAGDAFNLFMNGDKTPFSSTIPVASDECRTFTESPDVAFESPNWSSRRELLMEGDYEIQIQPIQSPFSGGKGAIRLMPVELSDEERGNLRVIATKMPYRLVNAVCGAMDLEPAALTAQDCGGAFKLTYDALGENEQVFIHDFDEAQAGHGEADGRGRPVLKPIIVTTGDKRGDGVVVLRNAGVPMLPVLCTKRSKTKAPARILKAAAASSAAVAPRSTAVAASGSDSD